jgi:hypothetical protein
MAKYYGKIGYVEMKQTAPGVWSEGITEREYSGDLIRNYSRYEAASGSENDSVNIGNKISILSDPYANHNFHAIRYAEFMGTLWKVTSVEVEYPRLILTLGGVYNGETS